MSISRNADLYNAFVCLFLLLRKCCNKHRTFLLLNDLSGKTPRIITRSKNIDAL